MSRVIRVSDEIYEKLENIAFKNSVGIQHLADKVINAGIESGKNGTSMIIEVRGHMVEIKW